MKRTEGHSGQQIVLVNAVGQKKESTPGITRFTGQEFFGVISVCPNKVGVQALDQSGSTLRICHMMFRYGRLPKILRLHVEERITGPIKRLPAKPLAICPGIPARKFRNPSMPDQVAQKRQSRNSLRSVKIRFLDARLKPSH